MCTVYLVVWGAGTDEHDCRVFSSLELAEALCAVLPGSFILSRAVES